MPKTKAACALKMLFAALALALALGACGAGITLEPGQETWGQISAVNGDDLSLLVGSMSEDGFQPDGTTATVSIKDASVVSDAGERLGRDELANGEVVRVSMGPSGITQVVVSRSDEAVAAEQGNATTILSQDGNRVDETFRSNRADVSALRVEAGSTTLVDCTVDKSGDASDVSKARLFGLNSAVLIRTGATATFDGGSISSSGNGSAGIFAYGASAMLNKTQVTTTKNDSGALVATSEGGISAHGAEVATSGTGSPAVRCSADGTVGLIGGELVTSGFDSPGIEAQSEVSANGTKLTAAHSEALVLSGGATASFENCSMAGAMDGTRGAHAGVNVQGVLIYQEGTRTTDTASVSLAGGSLTNNAGDLFYVTNASADLTLERVDIQNADASSMLVRVDGNDGSLGWGEAGENGGAATLTCVGQELRGNMFAGMTSTLSVRLTEGSTLIGALSSDAGADGPGSLDVVVEEGSTWRLTADSKVTSLENHGTVVFDGHTLTLADGSVLGG